MPEGIPRDSVPAVVPGAQPKICVVRSDGRYVAEQTAEARYERWLISEDLAGQFAPITRNDTAAHPEHSSNKTRSRWIVPTLGTGSISWPETGSVGRIAFSARTSHTSLPTQPPISTPD